MVRTEVTVDKTFSTVRSLHGYRKYLLMFMFAFTGPAYSAAQPWTVSSPDSDLVIEVKQDVVSAISQNRNCYFRVLLAEEQVLDWSPLGVTTNDQNFVSDLEPVAQSEESIDETYTLPSGKRSTYRNHCNELSLTFSNGNNREIVIYLRAYNDAAAFSYELLGTGTTQVTGEVSGFNLPSGSTGWGHEMPNDEQTYDRFEVGADAVTRGIPVLFETSSGHWVLITEAAVFGDYTGTSFTSRQSTRNVFQTSFPEGQGAVSGSLPWKLPWRVAIIGNGLGPIVESSVVEHLNPPCELTDTSWIFSGRSTWSWLSQETGDINQQKRYIDFAQEMTWEFNLIDWNYDQSKVAETCEYGAQRGVSNELWYDYSAVKTQAQQDQVFRECRTRGIKSLKIDFIFDNYDENTSYNHSIMQWYDMTARNLAENNLMVTFHGCTVPRGERRRWPHIMTREGVLGYEWIGRGYPATSHNCMLPFTRNVIGPMDHTPVLFTQGQLTNGSGATRPTTDAHELALSVLYESGIQHFADRPEGYNGCIGKDFLKIVPSSWDDIRFIDGYPGQWVVMARRKGSDWYVAGINAQAGKTVEIPLPFLNEGSYTVDLYKDVNGSDRDAEMESVTVSSASPLSVWVNRNGGFCCRIPDSYDATTVAGGNGTFPRVNSRVEQTLRAVPFTSLQRTNAGQQRMHSGKRMYDLRGRRVHLSNRMKRVPEGVFIINLKK